MENEDNPVNPIDLSIFKDQIRQSLLNILDTLPKVKNIGLRKIMCFKIELFNFIRIFKRKTN